MSQTLSDVLEGLGLVQYLDTFQDEGFDSWDTVLDITESDLEALGVKLGHRRKLQRRIAHARGLPTNAALPSPRPNDVAESSNLDLQQATVSRGDGVGEAAVTKRKYRRHPKPDKNAPERPPSAYVLFSNKTREELKGLSLSFAEIAKIVGENWKGASKETREAFESQAMQAKEKYRRELSEYKKTAEHDQYARYLEDFKNKQRARGRALPDPSGSSTSGMGRSHRGGSSSSVGGTNSSCQQAKPVKQQIQPSEAPVSPGTVSQGPAFGTRNAPSAAQSGPHRHQKLSSLFDVLDNKTDRGRASTSSQESVWALYSPPGRPAIFHNQADAGASAGASVESTDAGVRRLGIGDGCFSDMPHLSSNEAQSACRTAPLMQAQPLLAYRGFR